MAGLKGGTTGQVLSKTSGTDMAFTWVAQDDSNAIQNAIVDAKGDLIAASANDTPARLAVGNNGETLVADSSTSTGLRYIGNYAAGKNAIINGAFNVWQRGTSFTTTGGGLYVADRWRTESNETAGSVISQQTFTPGSAPVSGYEGQYYLRFVKNGTTADKMSLAQRIEDVRTFAGQTVTISYWAKASTALTNEPLIQQNFGSGGSGEVYTTTGTQSLTTSWARYSVSITVPSISGKTVGTSSYVSFWPLRYTGSSNVTIEMWGVQIEAGSVATSFQTATGTIQGELAACQRYYWRAADNSTNAIQGTGQCYGTTAATIYIPFLVQMRIAPTSLDFSALVLNDGATNQTVTGAGIDQVNSKGVALNVSVASGLIAYRPVMLRNNTSASYVGLSAEL
jgi:hypothetical protein